MGPDRTGGANEASMVWAPCPRHCGSGVEVHLGTFLSGLTSLALRLLPQPFGQFAGVVRLALGGHAWGVIYQSRA